MVRIIQPPIQGKLLLQYIGSRKNLTFFEASNSKIRIEFRKNFQSDSSELAVKIKLFDDSEVYICLLNGKVFSLYNDVISPEWSRNNDAEVIFHDIILGNSFVYIRASLNIDIPIHDEIINDSYHFRIYAESKSVNRLLVNSNMDCENFMDKD